MSQKASVHVVATLADGTVVDVVSTPADMIRWEVTSAQHKWPDAERAPMMMSAFLAFAGGRRKSLHDLTWEQFLDQLEDLDYPDTDPEATADPTPPAPPAG